MTNHQSDLELADCRIWYYGSGDLADYFASCLSVSNGTNLKQYVQSYIWVERSR